MDPSSTQLLAGAQVFASYDGALVVYGKTAPYINVYRISLNSGFGARYSDPSTLQTGFTGDNNGHNVKFSTDGNFVVSGQSTTPFINAWAFSLATGFGAKFSDPTTLPGASITALATKQSEQGVNTQYIVGSYANNLISYYVSAAGGFSNVQIKSTPEFSAGATSLRFSPAGDYLFAQAGSALRAYPWTNSFDGALTRIGTVRPAPSSAPNASATNHGDIHPNGTWYITAADSFNFAVYPFTGTFGTRLTASYNSAGSSVEFSPSGFSVISNKNIFRDLTAHSFNSATGATTFLGNAGLGSIDVGDTYQSTISKTGDLVAAVGTQGSTSTYVFVYRFSDATGFGARLSNPSSLPAGACYSCAFL